MVSLLITAVLSASPLTPVPVDTPPTFPAPLDQLGKLKTMQDVIGVTLLEDGKRAPADLLLPQLNNRRHTLEFMRVYYPESARELKSSGTPIAWVHVDQQGRVAGAFLLTTSGHAALDTLSLNVLRIAEFKPAEHAGQAVGVWLPMPARVPPYEELMTALEQENRPLSEVPREVEITQKAVLLNRNQVEEAIVRIVHNLNPRLRAENELFARAQNAGGVTQVQIFIDEQGTVRNAVVAKTSGIRDLDAHALSIAQMMRFAPARNGDTPVAVWIEVPIRFRGR
jgi:TonB family protein